MISNLLAFDPIMRITSPPQAQAVGQNGRTGAALGDDMPCGRPGCSNELRSTGDDQQPTGI